MQAYEVVNSAISSKFPGITSRELAERVGCDPSALARSLSGRRNFGPEFGRLCQILELDVDDFPSVTDEIDFDALR